MTAPTTFGDPTRHATDTAYKAVHFIETYTGRAFHPLAPKVEEVSIIDIAHHLSNQCRYSGATGAFYSTAQHCCLLADYAEVKLKATASERLQILMHDAAEAYLVDVPRPIKQSMPQYREWDRDITMVIREWYGHADKPIPSWQDEIDSRIIVDERAQIMSDSGLDWRHDMEPLGIVIEPQLPQVAEQNFLARYSAYGIEHFSEHQYLRSGWGFNTKSIYVPAFATAGSDIAQKGEPDSEIVDLLEVDLRGGVGRVALRSPDGMMIRDTKAGKYPRPAWKFIHGKFNLVTAGVK